MSTEKTAIAPEHASAEDTRTVQKASAIEKLACHYVATHVWANQSHLVSTILQINYEGQNSDLFSVEDVDNLRVSSAAWDEDKLRAYVENEIREDWCEFLSEFLAPANEDEIEEWEAQGCEGEAPQPAYALDDYDLIQVRERIDEWIIENDLEYREVYEWWLVDPWLGARLSERDEVVLKDSMSVWWGRCTTGQAIKMDGIMQEIAAQQIEANPYLIDAWM